MEANGRRVGKQRENRGNRGKIGETALWSLQSYGSLRIINYVIVDF